MSASLAHPAGYTWQLNFHPYRPGLIGYELLKLAEYLVQLAVHVLHPRFIASDQYLAFDAGLQAPIDLVDQ